MNNNDLKSKLAAQRKWRETQPAQTITRQRSKKLWIVIGLLLVLLIANIGFLSTRNSMSTPTPVSIFLTSASSASTTPSPTPMIMTVCAENLNVRYTPNGSVRGYLKAGEVIELKLDVRGMSISQTLNHENWTLIAAPVEGWANSKYLCKQGDPHERNQTH